MERWEALTDSATDKKVVTELVEVTGCRAVMLTAVG